MACSDCSLATSSSARSFSSTRALLDVVAGVERDRVDDAGDFERQIGALDRAQAADRLDLRLPFARSRPCRPRRSAAAAPAAP